MLNHFRTVVPVILLSAMCAHAAETASAPAPEPQAKRDPSDPKAAIEDFLRSMQTGDEKAINASLIISPESKPAVDTFLNLISATNRLQSMAIGTFGASATDYFGAAPASQLEARIKAIQDAPVKMIGDSALINIPTDEATKQSGGTVVLKKSGAGWKIDAASLFNLSTMDKKETDKRVALAQKLLPITEQATKDIKAGKYASAIDAYQDFWTKSLDALKSVSPTTATAPATQQY